VLDVRAPSEFRQGHLSGAKSFPLFDDEQRARVGIAYNHQGRQAAVIQGLQIAGPKMAELAETALAISREHAKTHRSNEATDRAIDYTTHDPPRPRILVHCWRGGMRSKSVGWLLEQVGFDVTLLEGGYKAVRRRVLETFAKPWPLLALSGLTGAGKTRQLQRLAETGEQVIDLEALAHHRGSAFGGLGLPTQPTVEQFENRLASLLWELDPTRRIWVEDEGRTIGRVTIPLDFFNQFRAAPAIFMDVPRDVRASLLAVEYGPQELDALRQSINAISKRLGGQNVKRAQELLNDGQLQACADCLLEYYDRAYLHAKSELNRQVTVHVPAPDPLAPPLTAQLQAAADKAFTIAGGDANTAPETPSSLH